jgi:hypothetical protein
MPKNKRVSKQEYQHRLDTIAGLYARGLTTMQVVRAVCQQWDICERQAMRYLKDAKKEEDALVDLPLRDQYNRILMIFNFVHQQAVLLKDLDLTRRVALDRANLLKQIRKELLNDPARSQDSDFIGHEELEKFLQSFEEAGNDSA